MSSKRRVLLVEPFYGGSHKQFLDLIQTLGVDYDQLLGDTLPRGDSLPKKITKWPSFEFTLCSMRAKKWHWRARTSSLYFSQTIPTAPSFSSATISSKKSVSMFSLQSNHRDNHSNDTAGSPESFDILFTSSVLPLSDLLALRPDLARVPRKIVYFHENQLVYPTQATKERDFQYGYNQILSWLVCCWLEYKFDSKCFFSYK